MPDAISAIKALSELHGNFNFLTRLCHASDDSWMRLNFLKEVLSSFNEYNVVISLSIMPSLSKTEAQEIFNHNESNGKTKLSSSTSNNFDKLLTYFEGNHKECFNYVVEYAGGYVVAYSTYTFINNVIYKSISCNRVSETIIVRYATVRNGAIMLAFDSFSLKFKVVSVLQVSI
jgi:hypothetical protein